MMRFLGREWHYLDHMQTMCTSHQTDSHTNTSPLNFYWPDALPDAQPAVFKHCTHTHTHTRLMAFFLDYPGEPVPER